MDQTPTLSRFDDFYKNQTPPWVIGEPQPAIVALERDGHLRGRVLDIGCGTGEHTILLTRLGYDVLGVDGAPTAVEQARRNAAAHGVDARFEVRDALDLGTTPTFDTVVDSALFHVFDADDRARYVRSLRGVTRPGALVAVLALSDEGRGFGPQVSEQDLRGAFGEGWSIEELSTTTYRGVVTDLHAEALGLEVGTRVDEPAWLLRARRT
ncbi:class I SAM-dependent methyltransferase [Mycolicibacterium rufum]|uniref:Class I SAM-dependent methyltransferase n=1 Tax=Mycolicibacterium rufum TaxID=318424 RepID=A0A9X2Y996_9MYCO|nr:class I SAM-dependent methyltransferase [Mycolicibacterium rufum]KGI67491.1 SAM-dependent methyltransferase [Mycolicibacterium rufum]MCV7069199.1 class I SAM-dependent methyltransferase [Mycolicibacterium rufum]ULP38446.1 class I SAM-dependent methyltransferase [Mycolicibacterium rufum]